MTDRASHPKCEACKYRKSDSVLFLLLKIALAGAALTAFGWYVHTNEAALRAQHCRYAGLSARFPYHSHPMEHIQAKGYDNWCAAVAFISNNYETTAKIITQPGALVQYLGLAPWAIMTQAENELEYARAEREAQRSWIKVRQQ